MMCSATISKWAHQDHQSACMLMLPRLSPPPGKGRVKRWRAWLESMKGVTVPSRLQFQLQSDRIIVCFCLIQAPAATSFLQPLVSATVNFTPLFSALWYGARPLNTIHKKLARTTWWRMKTWSSWWKSEAPSFLSEAYPLKHGQVVIILPFNTARWHKYECVKQPAVLSTWIVHIEYPLVCTIKTHERISPVSFLRRLSPQRWVWTATYTFFLCTSGSYKELHVV